MQKVTTYHCWKVTERSGPIIHKGEEIEKLLRV